MRLCASSGAQHARPAVMPKACTQKAAPAIHVHTRRFFLTLALRDCQLRKTEGAGRPMPGSVAVGQSMLARTLRVVSGFPLRGSSE
jgi:hypothetical protein